MKQEKPIAPAAVARRRARKAEKSPPKQFTLNMATLRLPKGAKATLVKADGQDNTYRVQVELPGSALGERIPYPTIRAEPLTRAKVKGLEIRKELDGLHPPYLPVVFAPKRLKLKPTERTQPPFGFKFKRDGVLLDRPTNVFLPDERFIYQDTGFPWCTVGRVDTPLGTATGCTIGSRLLLTCSHAIQWNDNNTAGWVRFRPAYFNGAAPFGEAWATQVIFWSKAIGSDGLTDQETAFDYVVCVLDSTMGDVVGFPGFRAYHDSWNGNSNFQHMGYPSDLSGGERPAFQGNASISTVSDESTSGQTGFVLGHFNDVVPGHSGGPVWGWWAEEPWPRVVGVQSAEAAVPANNTSGDNEFGGGPALSALIAWARNNHP